MCGILGQSMLWNSGILEWFVLERTLLLIQSYPLP